MSFVREVMLSWSCSFVLQTIILQHFFENLNSFYDRILDININNFYFND